MKCGFESVFPIPQEIAHIVKYKLPRKIVIQLSDKDTKRDIKLENILITVERGYTAGPFFTDKNGKVNITKQMLKDYEKDAYSAGEGDHRDFELISTIDICIPPPSEIKQWIKTRGGIWNFISDNERKYWDDLDALLKAMREAKNQMLHSATLSVKLHNISGDETISCILFSAFN